MKPTDHFKDVIRSYISKRADNDQLFAKRIDNDKKNIDECCNFILNSVRESGCNGFTDEEIFSMAVHYYDEEDIDPKSLKILGCSVVVNHQIQLTEDEKKELEEKARKDYYEQCMAKQREKLRPKQKEHKCSAEQLTLF